MKKLLIAAFILVLMGASYLAISYRHEAWQVLPKKVQEETASFKEEKTIPGQRQNVVEMKSPYDDLEISAKKDGYRPPIARFMGRDIFAEQFFLPGHKVTDKEYQSKLVASKLRAFLGKLAVDDFTKAHNIEVMEGDIDDYILYSQRNKPRPENTEADQTAMSEKVNKRVAGIKYLENKWVDEEDVERRQELANAIAEQKKLLIGEQLRYMQLYSDSSKAISREVERKQVAWTILLWKRHAALYEVFGGKAICNHFGCQATEAYAKLMGDYIKTGAIEVLLQDPNEARPHTHGADGHVHYHDHDEDKASKQEQPKRHIDGEALERANFYFEKPIWLRSEEELKAMQFDKLRR